MIRKSKTIVTKVAHFYRHRLNTSITAKCYKNKNGIKLDSTELSLSSNLVPLIFAYKRLLSQQRIFVVYYYVFVFFQVLVVLMVNFNKKQFVTLFKFHVSVVLIIAWYVSVKFTGFCRTPDDFIETTVVHTLHHKKRLGTVLRVNLHRSRAMCQRLWVRSNDTRSSANDGNAAKPNAIKFHNNIHSHTTYIHSSGS